MAGNASREAEAARARVARVQAEKDARKQADLDERGQRLSVRYGLGECTRSWSKYEFRVRVFFGWVTLVILVIDVRRGLQGPHGQVHVSAPYLAAVAVAAAAALVPPRLNRTRVFLFEGGVARMSSVRPRRTVLRWADLEAVTHSVVTGTDDSFHSTATLLARPRTRLTVDSNRPFYDGEAIMTAAEGVLTGRLLGPLLDRVDAGLPVTIGPLTIDRSGISSAGAVSDGGQWHVPWDQLRRIDTHLHAQRVVITTGRRGYRQAMLHDVPNSFLARPVLEHVARQVRVPVGIGEPELAD